MDVIERFDPGPGRRGVADRDHAPPPLRARGGAVRGPPRPRPLLRHRVRQRAARSRPPQRSSESTSTPARSPTRSAATAVEITFEVGDATSCSPPGSPTASTRSSSSRVSSTSPISTRRSPACAASPRTGVALLVSLPNSIPFGEENPHHETEFDERSALAGLRTDRRGDDPAPVPRRGLADQRRRRRPPDRRARGLPSASSPSIATT